jgi:hypothetical protein
VNAGWRAAVTKLELHLERGKLVRMEMAERMKVDGIPRK